MQSPFARLFKSAQPSAAKVRSEDEDDVIDRKKDDAEDEIADPDDLDDLRDEDEDDDSEAAKARRKAKKAKAKKAEGDDDDDKEDEKDPKARAARARERGRVAAIMASDGAAANPVVAMRMAVSTNMSRAAAIGALQDMQPPGGARGAAARARLAGVDVPDVGNSGGSQQARGDRSLADAIISAGKRARGEA